jgi:hypothetical protein
MARRKNADVDSGLSEYSTSSYEDAMDENLFQSTVGKISDKLEFSDLEDKFHYLLSLSDEFKREYTKVKYKGKKVEVKPIGVFKKSGKYILEIKTGEIIIAHTSELS